MNVMITGASRGIGYETAKLFAKCGDTVIANYNNTAKPVEDLQKLYRNVTPMRADITNAEQVTNMMDCIIKTVGTIDVLINNAGIAEQKLFSDICVHDWDKMFNTNIKGMFLCTQGVLPGMIHKKAGKIINLSSVWGVTGASCEVHYSASKAAVIGFTKALAKELGPSNIQVNCVAPGVIETDMNAHLDKDVKDALLDEIPMHKLGTPIDIANCIFFLASSKANYITGQVISPNGGFLI